jgi:hypothetical protein
LRPWTFAALTLLAAAALGGCRDEDGRNLDFSKGQYAGPPIPTPSSRAAEGWRERIEKMRY